MYSLIANTHGEETVGRVLLVNLIELLVTNYGKNDFLTLLVDSTRIHLMPSMNPDGYAKSHEGEPHDPNNTVRYNSNNIDLKYSFPDVSPIFETPNTCNLSHKI